MENDIQTLQVKRSDSLIRIGLKDENGKDTGEYLQFDVEAINNALNFQECIELHKKNLSALKNQFIIIDKKQDHKGKKLMSANEEAKMEALESYYKKEMEALDLFIGKGKTQVILNIMGREPYFSMFDDISELLEPVLPVIEKGFKDFKSKIEKKYQVKEENVLE